MFAFIVAKHMIIGGAVKDTDGKDVFLKSITFEFMRDPFHPLPGRHGKSPVVIERGGDLAKEKQ